MKLDLNEFNDLDLDNIGNWALQVKVAVAFIAALLVFLVSYFWFVSDAIENLELETAKEEKLRAEFKVKYQQAVNLALYQAQLAEMESQFAQLLKMLPSQNEMPSLLDDLTFVATDNGLKISSLNWADEIERDFYVEFPINMLVVGDYHQLGRMVADVANLPRIVSLHDFVIHKQNDEQLAMNIQARTYRFKAARHTEDNNKEAK